MNHVGIAISVVENCYQILVDLKERLSNVRRRPPCQLASEEYYNEQLEWEICHQV